WHLCLPIVVVLSHADQTRNTVSTTHRSSSRLAMDDRGNGRNSTHSPGDHVLWSSVHSDNAMCSKQSSVMSWCGSDSGVLLCYGVSVSGTTPGAKTSEGAGNIRQLRAQGLPSR